MVGQLEGLDQAGGDGAVRALRHPLKSLLDRDLKVQHLIAAHQCRHLLVVVDEPDVEGREAAAALVRGDLGPGAGGDLHVAQRPPLRLRDRPRREADRDPFEDGKVSDLVGLGLVLEYLEVLGGDLLHQILPPSVSSIPNVMFHRALPVVLACVRFAFLSVVRAAG